MASRYWVGGTASWDGIAGTKWAETSGGPGGFSVPTTADDVFFDALSTGVCTIATGNIGAKSVDCTGFAGTITGTALLTVNGSVTVGTATTWTHTGTVSIEGTGTLTTAGKTFSALAISGAGITVQLGDALNISTRSITVVQGTFTTNNYSVTAGVLVSNNTNTRTINLGSSTVSLSGLTAINFTQVSGLTFNAGTSQINFSAGNVTVVGGVTFYNVSYTVVGAINISGGNTFNNLTIAGRTTVGISVISVSNDQIINGTLTLSVGISPASRTFIRSATIGATRTLTCAAVAALTDVDFRDITIAGAAAPVSGTRLGDGKGNTGITFAAAKTVYWRNATSTGWGSTTATWAATDGGTADATLFPLAQDTAVFPASYPNTGATISITAAYNLGTIDMSARTGNTMTLSCAVSPTVYGSWTNGTGTTLSGVGFISYSGRNTQTITSAGRAFTQGLTIASPGGTVQLADAYASNVSSLGAFFFTHGTFVANDYSVTLTGASSGAFFPGAESRVLSMGSGTWTIAGSNGWSAGSGLVVSGTSVISLTSASAKSFSGGEVQTYPTLNQGGTGTLTINGNNKFSNLTNTAIGRIQFTGGTVNELGAFSINGVSGNLLQLGSTNTTPAILSKPTAWNVGANSTDAGNNTGLSFTGTNPDFLSISYITGVPAGAISVVASGSEATAAVGSIQIVTTARVDTNGVQAQASVGNPSVAFGIRVTLTGVQAQAQLGSLTVTLGAGVPVTGVQAQAQLGTLSAGASNARTSVSGVYVVGSVGTTLVWGLVNDTQPADWHNINDSQDPGWAPVNTEQPADWHNINDSQAPGWVPVSNAQPPSWAPVD